MTIAAGATTGSFTVPINDDTISDPSETFTVRLASAAPDAGYEVSGSTFEVAVTITDEDASLAESTVEATTPVVADGTAESMVTVTLLNADGNPLGAAGAGRTVTLNTGIASVATTTISDVTEDPVTPGTYRATITSTAAQTLTVRASVDGVGQLDDTAEVVFVEDLTFADTQPALSFPAGTAITPVTLPGATGGLLSGSITYTVDPSLPRGLTLETTPGAAPRITGTPTEATAIETYTVTARQAGPPEQTATLGFSITVTAPAPAVTVSGTGPVGGRVAEGGTAGYTVTLNGSPSADVEVTWAVTAGGAGASATDVEPEDFGDGTQTTGFPSGTLRFAAGATGGDLTQSFDIDILDDTAHELDTETFTVTLGTNLPDVVDVGTPALSVETTITDDDAPSLSFDGAATRSVAEEAGPLALDVTLSGTPAADVTVQVQVADGTATSPADYSLTGDGSLSFAEGAEGAALTQRVMLTIVDNTDVDGDRSFTVSLVDPPTGDATIGDPSTVTVTITDDEVPAAMLSGPATVTEGQPATYTVTLNGSPSEQVDVDWAVTHGGSDPAVPATDADDFSGAVSGTLRFAAGVTGGALSQTFTVTSADDAADEPDTETFTVTLDTAEDADVLVIDSTAASLETTITDNDVPVASIAGPATVAEDATDPPTYTVTLDRAPAQDVMVAWEVVGGTAPSATAADFGDGTAGTLPRGRVTIAAGARTGSFPVTLFDDDDSDPGETFTVSLPTAAPGAGYAVSGSNSGVAVTITDEDASLVRSTVEATTPVVADGTDASTVTVTLLDADGTRLDASGGTVTLEVTGSADVSGDGVTDNGDSTWTAKDNGDGTWTAEVTNTVVEDVTVRAALDGMALSNTAQVVFIVGDTASMALHAESPVTVGTASTVTVRLEGMNSGTVNDRTMLLEVTGEAEISDEGMTETGEGTWTATITNMKAETVTVTASLDGTPLTDMAEVQFAAELAFASAVSARSLTVGRAVDLTLPEATGGAGGVIGYALEGDLPDGLYFDATEHRIAGTPTEAQDETEYTLTATETGGTKQMATLTFMITVAQRLVDIVVSPSELTVQEGNRGRYTVRLGADPEGEVTVDVTSDNGDVTPGTAMLVFDSTTWDQPQTVTVTSVADSDTANDTAVITHRLRGSGVTGEATTVTVTVRAVDPIREVIADYLLNRADALVSNQPGLIRFLKQDSAEASTSGGPVRHFNLTAEEGSTVLDGGVAHRGVEVTSRLRFGDGMDLEIDGSFVRGGVWGEITAAWTDRDTARSSYVLGTLGTHRRVSEHLLAGAMVQFDFADEDLGQDRGAIDGRGWMAGPYFAARHTTQPLWFEGRLLYGRTDNDILFRDEALGLRSGSFDTTRWLAQFRMEGEVVPGDSGVRLMPFADAAWVEDRADAFTDDTGVPVPGQTVRLRQFELGSDIEVPVPVRQGEMTLTGGLSMVLSDTDGARHAPAFAGPRGRVEFGVDYRPTDRARLRFDSFYDGIGASGFDSWGLSLGAEVNF